MKHILITTIAAVLLVGTAFADPIHDAANIGDIGDVQVELDAGVDVNAKDNLGTFRYAVSGGHKEIAELLIAEGADVNATDEDDETPLDWVIKYMTAKTEYKHTKTADLLCKHGGKTGEELKAEGN
jgi:ankyrin repeat protein